MADKTVDILLKIESDLDGIRQAKEETNRFRMQLNEVGNFFRSGVGFGAGFLSVEAFTRAMGDALSAGIKFNANVEQQTVAFETLLGSQEAAVERIGFLNQFSASTPFELGEVVEANRLLQTLTDGALATEAGMRLAGDAAAAAGRDFTETAMWVGRLYSSLQSGLPIGEATMRLTEMGLISGETRRELERLSKDGALGAAEAMRVLENTLGSTAGAMEKQSQTFNGLLSTVKDNLLIIMAELTKPQFEGLKVALEAIGQGIGAIETEEQKRVRVIDEQTQKLREQVQVMSSLEEMEAARSRLESAQSTADRRIESLQRQREILTQMIDASGTSDFAGARDDLQDRVRINEAEMDAYREQRRVIQEELLRFSQLQVSETSEEIDGRISRARAALQSISNQIADQTRPEGIRGADELGPVDRPAPDQRLITQRAQIEDQIQELENLKRIAEFQESIADDAQQTAAGIMDANRARREAEELEKTRTDALREAQDWLSKNRDKIEESIESRRFENLELSQQLALLQARSQQVEEDFTQRISASDQETVKERLNLELTSEKLSLSKQIADIEAKIVTEKSKQADEAARANREQTKAFIAAQEQSLQMDALNVARARAVIQSDFTSTSAERRAVEVELLRREVDLQRQFVEQLQKRQALENDDSTRELLRQRIDAAQTQLFSQETQLIQMDVEANPFSFADQFESELVQMRDSWGTFAQQAGQGFANAINTSINSASRELTNAILITGQWQDALMSIPRVITTEIVNAIIQMGLRWIATQAMMAMFGKQMQATMVATTAPMAAASAALWSGPATLATIATGGASAAAAPGAIAGSLASTRAISVVGFRGGGYTGDGRDDEAAGIVHKNEVVIPAPIVREIGVEPLQAIINREIGRDEINEIRQGTITNRISGGGGLTRPPDPLRVPSPIRPSDTPFASPSLQQSLSNIARPVSADQLAPVFDPQINVGSPGVHVVVVDSPQRLQRMIEDNPDLQDSIVKVLDGRGGAG